MGEALGRHAQQTGEPNDRRCADAAYEGALAYATYRIEAVPALSNNLLATGS